jgi:fused signal recognition particle receptor
MDDALLYILIGVGVLVLVVIAAVYLMRADRGEVEGLNGAAAPARSAGGGAFGASLRRVLGGGVGDETWSALEEALLAADVGVEATGAIVGGVRSAHPETVEEARRHLARLLRAELGDRDRELSLTGSPAVILVVGVNGTGKTTTIAKLAAMLDAGGKEVVLAAADTFRAAAGAQLQTWGDRLGVAVVQGQEGGDPASVAFDAIGSARAKGADVVIVDTAGRLHAKKNLMSELAKIHRVTSGDRGGVDEVLLVLDATAGQNGITQVEEFSDAVPLSGIVLTKLDGTARGGIVIAIERRLGMPVKFVGLGEGLEDLVPFDPDRFVAELLED